MGKLTVNGFDALIADLAALASLPDSVTEEILGAEADIVVEAQRSTAQSMGVYDTGMTAGSIKKGKVKKSASGKSITVSPQGTNSRGDRNAEVAFINEYGKRGQTARPFIRKANETAEPKAVEAGEKVYHDFLDRNNI